MKGFPDPFEFWSCAAARLHVQLGHRNRLCGVRPCIENCKTPAVDAAAASDSESENLEAVLKRFACQCDGCPAKLEYVATSRVPPGSCARKRGDNSVPFGGDPCSARRSPDVPGVVECFVDSTKRVLECQWGSPRVGPVLQVTTAAKSGRRSEAACWSRGRQA
jgi:hypothetical protein